MATRTHLSRPVRTRGSHPRIRPRASPPAAASEPIAQPAHWLTLDSLASHWQRALDAGERALGAAGGTLPDAYVVEHRHELTRERRETAETLTRLARARGVRPPPWLSPVRVDAAMLGLPATISACLFDLDGVLTDSGLLHAWAWGEVFDAFLLLASDETGWQFVPFDRHADYRAYIDGRSRLEGVHAFLDSRGIRVPEGRSDDPSHARTAWGLANRKGETLARGLERRGVTSLPGARRYLEVAGHAGLGRGVISASASTLSILERAALATLSEVRVDAEVIRGERLHTLPAPDVLLTACRRLGVAPERAVTFTHSAAGVAAGLHAGLTVIGVGTGADEERLLGFGAQRVVPSLGAALAPQLLDSDASGS
jgi:beta-phosphoglucomutase-like phosphatase (HAD superfamily)